MSTQPRALRPLRVLASPYGAAASGNPYITQLYGGLSALGWTVDGFTRRRLVSARYDVVHLHWPEWAVSGTALTAVWRGLAMLAAMWLGRRRGTRVVWTVHNLRPHEEPHPWLMRIYRAALVRLVDATISLTRAARTEIQSTHPPLARRRMFVVPHGDYRSAYPEAPSRHVARQEFGIASAAPVLLFFGQIRPYKGIQELVNAFERWERPDARLIVAGQPLNRVIADELRSMADRDDRIQLRLGFVPDDEVPRLFALCDLVVLPYRRILNSGAALLALSFARPVLVPKRPQLAELRDSVGASWILMFEAELTATTLAEGAAAALAVRAGSPDLSAHAWTRVVEQTATALNSVSRG